MGIYLNSDVTATSIIVNNMYSKIQTNTSQFLNVETDDFSSMLKQGSKTENKKNNEIYKSETADNEKNDIRNKELKNLLSKSNMDRMMFEISQGLNKVSSSPLVNNLASQAIKSFV